MEKRNTKEHAETKVVANCDQLTNTEIATQQFIQNYIITIRGKQVMLDRDLAVLYGVETKNLNKAVKRNIERFPEDFMFQLSKDEFEYLKSQIATSNMMFQNGISKLSSKSEDYEENDSLRFQFGTSNRGGNRYLPYAFTENGIAMLSGVLHSQTAVAVNIRIMRAFTAMRQFLGANAQMFNRIEVIEFNQLALQKHQNEADQKIDEILDRLQQKQLPLQGIFYDGQIYDAHSFVCDLIKEAKERIVVVDNYLDNTVLTRLAYRRAGLPVTIYTKTASKQFSLDIKQHNAQYPSVELRTTTNAHDRFLIIDNNIYHLGASIKDLGKKIFAFSLMEEKASELLKRLEE